MKILTVLLVALILGGSSAFCQDEISRKRPKTESSTPKKATPKKKSSKDRGDMSVAELRKKGLDLYMRDRRKEALPYIEKGVEAGDAECIFYMGEIYRLGIPGIMFNIDYDKALDYYLRAADMGHPEATYMVGCMYDWVDSSRHDYTKAAEWYAKAADLGHWYAAYKLGEMYEHGKGVTKSLSSAIEWYRRAAEEEAKFGEAPVSKSRLQELGVPGY